MTEESEKVPEQERFKSYADKLIKTVTTLDRTRRDDCVLVSKEGNRFRVVYIPDFRITQSYQLYRYYLKNHERGRTCDELRKACLWAIGKNKTRLKTKRGIVYTEEYQMPRVFSDS